MMRIKASSFLLTLSVIVKGMTIKSAVGVTAQEPTLVVLETLPGDQLLQVVEAAGGYTFFATYDCSTNETKVYGPPTLDYIGENLGNQQYGLCQGHCVSSYDCEYGLNCFQRDGVETKVPGCLGEGISGKGYCYAPEPGELVLLGDEDEPVENFPLRLCASDCDSDFDCEGDLMCFQRGDTEPVPGCTGTPLNSEDYCIERPTPTTLIYKYDNNKPQSFQNYPLKECMGDCDDDNQCMGDLICYQREGTEEVPGCEGRGVSGKDYCIDPQNDPRKPLTIPTHGSYFNECEGSCSSTDDCNWGFNCFERSGTEEVPGCKGQGVSGANYCVRPAEGELVLAGNNGIPSTAFPLQHCQADCDSDIQCSGTLMCLQREDNEPVEECSGAPLPTEDYCVSRPTPNFLIYKYDNDIPKTAENFPLAACVGDCDNDEDCGEGLRCFQRSGDEAVPGCEGPGLFGVDYCIVDEIHPTPSPVSRAPVAPVPDDATYRPGELTVFMNGLKLSTGLSARVIAETGKKVQFDNGGESERHFHSVPDGAGVFVDEQTGRYAYVSNSEDSSIDWGGVGAIYFDTQGKVVDYQPLLGLDPSNNLPQTRRNCGGGKTYWNTWITCEEHDGGQNWEVDPWGNITPTQTILGPREMNYEAAAFDNRDVSNPSFYVTVDESAGPLVRFTPDPALSARCLPGTDGKYKFEDCSPMLYDKDGGSDAQNGNHQYHYFEVTSIKSLGGNMDVGTYQWSSSLEAGRNSASLYHRAGEGIDIKDGKIYYTTKSSKYLFIIDLDPNDDGELTFVRSSTVSGAFDGQPDQVARVLNFETGETNGILYFCEDGGTGDKHGVHARDAYGEYYTILEDASDEFQGETTGLAFSPDGMYMYVSFQGPGLIYEVSRDDGYPFYGAALEIMHHMADGDVDSITVRHRNLFAPNAKTCDLVYEMCNV